MYDLPRTPPLHSPWPPAMHSTRWCPSPCATSAPDACARACGPAGRSCTSTHRETPWSLSLRDGTGALSLMMMTCTYAHSLASSFILRIASTLTFETFDLFKFQILNLKKIYPPMTSLTLPALVTSLHS